MRHRPHAMPHPRAREEVTLRRRPAHAGRGTSEWAFDPRAKAFPESLVRAVT